MPKKTIGKTDEIDVDVASNTIKKTGGISIKVSSQLISEVDQWMEIVEKIAKKSEDIDKQHTQLLYDGLAEIYAVYYHWMDADGKDEFFSEIETHLGTRGINYKSDTDEALKLVKALVGKRSGSSKYAKHIRVAFNRKVLPQNYREWLEEYGIEIISRQVARNPSIAAPRMSKESKESFSRASNLIYAWLKVKEMMPISSEEANLSNFEPGVSELPTYEISITKTRPHPTNEKKIIIDTLWTLPRTGAMEVLFIGKLALALSNNEAAMEELEKLVAADDMLNMKSNIEHELTQAEMDAIETVRYEREFIIKANHARFNTADQESSILAGYDPRPSRFKKKIRKKTNN